MSKISLDRLSSQFGFQAAFNSVLQSIEDEFANRVLYRDNPVGEPNSMNNDLDMAGYDVVNVATISASDFKVNGENLTGAINEAVAIVEAAVVETAALAAEAEASAVRAGEAAEIAESHTPIDYSVPGGSGLVGFIQAGTGAVARTVEDKLRESYSVKDFGAVGDGVTDDTVEIQACINATIAAGGGVVYFPEAPIGYRVTSSLTIDYTSAFYTTNSFNKKIIFKGEGSASTAIFYDNTVGQCIDFKGNATNNTAHFEIEGMRLSGSGLTAVGIFLKKAAYVTFEDVIIELFDTAWYAEDAEQLAVYDTEIRFNRAGIISYISTITSPNSWSFYNSTIANNREYGADLLNVNGFNWNGGSIQYNGLIGGGNDQFGIRLIEAGNGYGTVGFTNTAFEGNGGLADFVSVQSTYPANISFDNVGFMRTGGFASATVQGAANNGSGAIRLTVDSTAALVGATKVFVNSVVGTTKANSATPWSFTIIDATHIDLVGSTYSGAYVSGGLVVVVGFATNNIYIGGSQANAFYSITNSNFRSEIHYLPSASRPTIALENTSAKFSDDGTNYFQNASEKLAYPPTQMVGDDGSAWTAYTPTATAASGTFTATATGRYKKIGKTVHFEAVVTTTAYTATPGAPLAITLPFTAVAHAAAHAINISSANNSTGFIEAATRNVRIWQNGAFPIIANGNQLVVSGTYETS